VKKRIVFLVLLAIFLVSGLAGLKALQIGALVKHQKAFAPPPVTVTSAEAQTLDWPVELTAVGALSAVQGITVAAELVGTVTVIAFEPGAQVRQGDLLVRQDTSLEEAQLPGAEAALELARLNRERNVRMFQDRAVSEVERDTAVAAYDQALAQVNTLKATIAKKTLRAPFAGHLGVRQASLGQLLRPGDPIVSLEALDPIFADFSLPQQELGRVKPGQTLLVTCDALPGRALEGRVTAVNPQVDSDTRNVKVQATLRNPDGALRPGMFINVALRLPGKHEILAIPATAVLYAPYGDSVFVIEPGRDGQGQALRQQTVRIGEKRGDLVAVTSGLKPGQVVASTGVFKLNNGAAAVVDNTLAPPFQPDPQPENK
jgi:membrane fusion protein (multidrug efflux system)